MNLDANWVLVAITTIYTVATIIICWANWRSSSAARKQTEEMIRQYQDSKRARIAIRFDKRCSIDRNIVLKNVGKEDARRVLDFLSGATFMIEGNIQKVSSLIYLMTPRTVEIQNDLENAQASKQQADQKQSFSWLK